MFFITMLNEKSLNQFIDYIEHFGLETANAATEFFEAQRQRILENGDIDINDKPIPLFKIV